MLLSLYAKVNGVVLSTARSGSVASKRSTSETPIECCLYVNSWHSRQDWTFYQPNIGAYAQLMSDFDTGSPADNSIKTHVRFSSGGVNNSRNVRLLSRQTQVLIPGKTPWTIGRRRTIYRSLFRIMCTGHNLQHARMTQHKSMSHLFYCEFCFWWWRAGWCPLFCISKLLNLASGKGRSVQTFFEAVSESRGGGSAPACSFWFSHPSAPAPFSTHR